MERIPCPLFKTAQERPEQVAIVNGDCSITYKQLDIQVSQLCHHLEERTIKKQDLVAFIAEPTFSTVLLFLALMRLGAIACPLSTRLSSEQLSTYLDRLNSPHVIDTKQLDYDHKSPLSPVKELDLALLSTFLFTSGSTGVAKIVALPLSAHYYNALGCIEPLKMSHTSHYLLSLPLFHVSGISILFRALLSQSTLVLSSLPLPQAIEYYPLSHLSLVPTQLYRLLESPTTMHPKNSLQCVLLGGSPASHDLLQRAKSLSWPIQISYGMTEASSLITMGSALKFREVRIKKGEIYIRGETLFAGYWDSQSKKIIDPKEEGWFATKDVGYLDEKGVLQIIGRKDRQFISGGENIQPEEIEKVLLSLPGIAQAKVEPKYDAELGSCPIAFLDDTTGKYTVTSLQEALTPYLEKFKHPIEIHPFSRTTPSKLSNIMGSSP